MILVLLTGALSAGVLAQPGDPFAFLQPTVTITQKDRQAMDAGRTMVRIVPGRPREIGIATAARTRVDGARLAAWYREIASLRRSAYVPEIARFSNPPRLDDLNGLTLEDTDLEVLRRCRPGNCDMKLSRDEIVQMGRDIPGSQAQWDRVGVERAFRQMVLRRAERYLEHGRQDGPPPPAFLGQISRLREYITGYRLSRETDLDVESLLYWSKERFHGKPVVAVSHVAITRGAGGRLPDPLIVTRQVFATHYLDGAWAAAAILAGDGDARYLVYVNHSELDLLRGVFGGIVRAAVQRELTKRASGLLEGIRARLESGDPPSGATKR